LLPDFFGYLNLPLTGKQYFGPGEKSEILHFWPWKVMEDIIVASLYKP